MEERAHTKRRKRHRRDKDLENVGTRMADEEIGKGNRKKMIGGQASLISNEGKADRKKM